METKQVYTNTGASASGNGPAAKFRAGPICATVWQNQGKSKSTGEDVTYNTVSLERSYKDKNGNWQTTNSFRVNDLPRAALVLKKAYEHIVLKGNSSTAIVEEVVM